MQLTRDALDALLDHPAVKGSPITTNLAPGLNDRDIDSIASAVGFRLPEELRILWRWHNGILADASPWNPQLGGFEVLSLQAAVDAYFFERQLDTDDWSGSGEWFPPTFFPFSESFGNTTAADCSQPHLPCAPVHFLPSHDVRVDCIATPEVASLGEWAQWQLQALDEGQYWWDATRETWCTPPPTEGDNRRRGPAFLDHFRGWR